MKIPVTRFLLCCLFCFAASQCIYAQNKRKVTARLTAETVVKDTSGREYPASVWQLLVNSGDYYITPVDSFNIHSDFLLHKADSNRKALRKSIPPPQSSFFSVGGKFGRLKEQDLNKETVDSRGRILVLNYWFINCPPCRLEIPQLNRLADSYRSDSNVVFAAITPDSDSRLETFLSFTRFSYHIIPFGDPLIRQYRINAFPVHVVVNKEGRVVYHSVGSSPEIEYWLKKAIEECR
ncbi:MAG: TlpA family protein disulfide reductase [Chitinophagaceae bacterium]|nr:TlpA family protein disulfide reductase [Chitinophagaceae bacterium]